MRRPCVALAILTAVGGGAEARKAAPRPRVEKDTVAGGEHWRIRTDHGAVHVWRPAIYEQASAGTVVYVHGYGTSADEAWREHGLARQFRASRQNALFVVCEAPSGNGEEVDWMALGDLLRAVRGGIRSPLPDGHVVAIAHSGGFRTVVHWLDYRRLDHVILLDALYGRSDEFEAWLTRAKHRQSHKLTVVAYSTLEKAETFVKPFRFVARRDRIPDSFDDFLPRQRRAQLLFLRSQYDHMELVTGGVAIPLLLRLTRLRRM